jgi:hypothetical protein
MVEHSETVETIQTSKYPGILGEMLLILPAEQLLMAAMEKGGVERGSASLS